MARSKGKISTIRGNRGLIRIEGSNDLVSFVATSGDFKVNDTVKFNIVVTEIELSEETFEEAKDIILVHRQESGYIKLSDVSKKLDVQVKDIIERVEVLNGQVLDENPDAEIPLELFDSLKKVYEADSLRSERKSQSFLQRFPVGTILEARILKKINPGTLAIYIDAEITGTVSLLDLAWNLARAEILFAKYSEGDQLHVVVLDYSEKNKHVRLSVKHLLPKPSETSVWKDLKLTDEVNGRVIDKLLNGQIVELDNGLIGIYYGPDIETNKYQVVWKEKVTNLLVLTVATPSTKRPKEEKKLVAPSSEIKSKEIELLSYEAFRNSIFADFAEEQDLNFIQSSFEIEPDLFSKEVISKTKILLNFEFNSNAWSSFESQIVAGLLNVDNSNGNHTARAIETIESSTLWVSIAQRRNYENDSFTIYNDTLNFHGDVKMIDENACHFTVFNVSFGRAHRNAGSAKKNGAKFGSFLLKNGISISPPDKVITAEKSRDQFNLYDRLKTKYNAFYILDGLKVQAGEILRSEGEALRIFDKFLEYQEDHTRSNQPPPVELKNIKRTFGGEFVTWELPPEVSDYLSDQEDEVYLDLREKVKSTKKKKQFEYKKIGSAKAIEKNDRWVLSIEDSLPLDEVHDLYVQKKASVRQFQIQREIIRDFFDKKLRLDHIENLLVRPERIKAPVLPHVDFKNPILKLAEKEQPKNNQVKAVKKAIGNSNIFLIQGPPGTGKTTVIAEVVRQLVASNEKVLVASQTHIAVDNVLEKLASIQELSLLRIGSPNKILESVKHFHPSEQIKLYTRDFEKFIDTQARVIQMYIQERDLEEIKVLIRMSSEKYSEAIRDKLRGYSFRLMNLINESNGVFDFDSILSVLDKWKTDINSGLHDLITPLLYSSVDVVFSTCIGIKSDREFHDADFKFDTVIIDEAGKANLAESLVAVSMAKKVILVGDQMQLPPYIDGNLIDPETPGSFPKSKYGYRFVTEDVEHALKTSFFEFLVNRIEKKSFPESNLEMLNYQHRMHPNIGEFVSKSFYKGNVNMGAKTHLNRINMDPPFDREVTFINTGSYHNPYEDSDGFSARNKTEALTIVQSVLPKLRSGGIESSSIAVIAPYKSQVALIKKEIDSSQDYQLAGIEVSTLDSFQGMEFDVIVFSFTRSANPNQENKKVGFLDDARRLNVAFSRAKKKLILVGNAETLTHPSSHYDRLFNYTQLFKNLVKLSKDPKVGKYCDMTDFKSLKSPFERFKERYPLWSTIENARITGIAKDKIDQSEYGLFVKVDGLPGLIYNSDISDDFINRVSDLYDVGQLIKVVVIKYDVVQERIRFGIKQLKSISKNKKVNKTRNHQKQLRNKPQKEILDKEKWLQLKKEYHVGKVFNLTIDNVAEFGVFVKLSDTQKGMVHKSQLNPRKRKSLKTNYSPGDKIAVFIRKHDDHKKRMELSESLALLKMKKS